MTHSVSPWTRGGLTAEPSVEQITDVLRGEVNPAAGRRGVTPAVGVADGVRDNITVVVDAVQVAGSTVISDRDEVERTRPRVADGVWERA